LYIRQKTNEELKPYFRQFLPQASDAQIDILIPVLKERLTKFGDLPEAVKFLFEDVEYDKDLLLKKGTDPKLAVNMLSQAKNILTDFSRLQEKFLNLIKENNWNTGEFFMILRVAICGSLFTPPLVECLPALGQEKALKKIEIALKKLT
jgi:glutamyl/glutaminyl-tRNA synthetase